MSVGIGYSGFDSIVASTLFFLTTNIGTLTPSKLGYIILSVVKSSRFGLSGANFYEYHFSTLKVSVSIL